MKKIGIIICGRYQSCSSGKCFRSLKEHQGGFALYPKEEKLELVGYTYCGGCPGGNIEYAPAEMKKNGVDIIHFATGMIVGYPPCPNIKRFKEFIEKYYEIPVVFGTHPIPLKYFNAHKNLSFWDSMGMKEHIRHLLEEKRETMKLYD
ncbi:MAG: CGGC domain-containing protein [Spirochaetes bacterium]|nr:CGGC domain-containing protein [Spirochaetota bacterium]